MAWPLASVAVWPSTATVCADKASAVRRLRGLLQRNQRGELIVLLELLLDLRELHELLGELVGVQRIERVLVLELRRQQLQEGLKLPASVSLSTPVVLADDAAAEVR